MTATERLTDANIVLKEVAKLSDPSLTQEQKQKMMQEIEACQDILRERK